MSWASLWWRVCLLARLHARRVRVRWLLWRRSRRTLRPGVPVWVPETTQLKAAYHAVTNPQLTRAPGDIIYLPATSRMGFYPSAASAEKILALHEAMLEQQRQDQRKREILSAIAQSVTLT